MFKIGEFSKLAMITVKSLRFYDETGLLKPKEVDKWTGYRYYSSDQLYEAGKIVALRQAGLSISEIKNVMSGNNAALIFERRKDELKRELTEAELRYERIQRLIENFKENNDMKFQATVKQLPEYTVFYGEGKLHDFNDLCRFIVELGKECGQNNPDLKCLSPEYCYVTYLDDEFTDTDFTCEYAQAVERTGKESEKVKFKTMLATTAVSVIVKGDYSNLSQGYAYIIKWIHEHGYRVTDRARERYIEGVWNKKNPDDYVTELQFPVEKISE